MKKTVAESYRDIDFSKTKRGGVVPRELFDIDLALQQVEEAVRPFPKAGLFELAEEGFGSPFELLVACIISIRTFDEVMMKNRRTR